MEYIEVSAKTVNEAITKACMQLGKPSDGLDIQVVSEGSKGFLGFGSKPAVIKVAIKAEEKAEKAPVKKEEPKQTKKEEKKPAFKEQKANKETKVSKEVKANKEVKVNKEVKTVKNESDSVETEPKLPVEKAEVPGNKNVEGKRDNHRKKNHKKPYSNDNRKEERKPAAAAESKKPERKDEIVEKTAEEIALMKASADKFLKDVFGAMGMEVVLNMEYIKEGGCLEIDFSGADMGVLIGKRGQTLDSLQYLTSLVVNKEQKAYVRVKLDTEDYRRRRKETLENLAKNIASKVRKTRKSVVLEPMNPYERRIIHSALQPNKYVETYSEGNEPYRHVVVTLKKQ